MGVHWKVWCWNWNSNTLATWCNELTHLKRPWCWERLRAGGEGDNRGWDGWMASLTQWTWVWVGSGSWCWSGRPGMLQLMGSQKIGHDWATELNWTNLGKGSLRGFILFLSYFSNSFIKVLFMCHTIYPFKQFNSLEYSPRIVKTSPQSVLEHIQPP